MKMHLLISLDSHLAELADIRDLAKAVRHTRIARDAERLRGEAADLHGIDKDAPPPAAPTAAEAAQQKADDTKAFETARALAALDGFGLMRGDGDGDFIIVRWDTVRLCRSLTEVHAFLTSTERR